MLETIVGIVAEYNPLHNGHAYHMLRAKELSGAQGVVVVLSSHFVQRGEPALVDKWTRTAMALACGADVVVELPTVFSCHNAGVFANAAIDLLAAFGGVTHVAFGMENPEEDLSPLVSILVEEPVAFKDALQSFLREGFSFVEARSRALDSLVPGSASLLRGANNTLALAYCCRIRSRSYPLQPVRVQRRGSGYHDTDIMPFSSATAIREALRRGDWEPLSMMVPETSSALLRQARDAGRLAVDFDALGRLARTILLRLDGEELQHMAEMREGMEFRIRRAAEYAVSWEELVQRCISRRYPRGRVQRHIIHVLLGLTHWENRAFQRLGPPYIRVLGVSEFGRILLRKARSRATLPVLSKASPPNGRWAHRVMALEHRAAAVWEMNIQKPEIRTEARRKVLLSNVVPTRMVGDVF